MNVELMLRIIQSCVCCIQASATEEQQRACLCVSLGEQLLISAEMKRQAALFKARRGCVYRCECSDTTYHS